MKIIGIYKITSPSGKIYIGQSIDVLYRISQYKKYKCKLQTKLYHSLLKYGASAHTFEILVHCDVSELDFLEKKLIKQFNSVSQGLNLRSGGSHGTHSEASRVKMSVSQRKRGHEISKLISSRNIGNTYAKGRKLTDDQILKLKLSKQGRPSALLGRKLSKETIEKMRAVKAGTGPSKETGRKISAKLKGRKMSDEWRQKISNAMKGNSNREKNESIEY